MAMEERHAVALAQRHRRKFQPRDAGRPKRPAVERRILASLRQRRHHIGERAECPAPDVQRAAEKSFRCKTTAGGF
jgi:hypothetical protein